MCRANRIKQIIGDTAGAIESYRKAISLFNAILSQSSEISDRRELVQARQKLAVLLMRAGSPDVLEIVNSSVAVSEQIAAENPDSLEDKLSLAKSYISLADISPLGTGENGSVPVLQKALAIVEPIIQTAPENADALYRQAAINQRLGFHYRRLGELAAEVDKLTESQDLLRKSAAYYASTLQSAEKMMKLDAQNASYLRNYSLTKLDEATVQRELGENDKALPTLLKVLSAGKSSFTGDLENVQAVADLGGVNIEIALAYLNLNDLKLAEKYGKTAVSLLDVAVVRDPNNLEYYRGRFDTMMIYGSILTAENNFDAAIENYRTAFDELQKAPIKQDSAALAFYESRMREKIADANILSADKAGKSPEQKRRNIESAQAEYKKTLELLQSLKNSQGKSSPLVSSEHIIESETLN